MNDVCSLELLTNAVANRLTADEEAALYDHLERCEACCARMEQLAGGEQWQQEAAALLTTDELDAAVPEPMVWSEVDFSVEHLEPSEDANVLGQLGGYDVLAIIGRGGMGVVLKAFDRELKRFVAIKALSPHLAHSSVARKRFAREAQAAAAVVNPHVIAIHHVQPTGRLPFLIMPLLTGESLAQRLKSRAPLELTEVLRIGMQVAVGLAAAHDQGLVHRDVKPANIFLEKGVERVVITDFGLARAADDVSMTRQGVVAGTPEYMSPEQARGDALDGRSDLFSLGCVLYEMATGVSPFRSDTTIATLRRIVDERPAAMASLAPELPPWFSYIVERLLSKDPAQRFTSANEVALLLEQCLSHLQQPASVPLPVSLAAHAQGHRSIFNSNKKGILTMLGTLGTALLGMVLWQATDPPDISGQWTGEKWGTVDLEAKGPGQYEGTFTDSVKSQSAEGDDSIVSGGVATLGGFGRGMRGSTNLRLGPGNSGTLQLKWSRPERRFNGTWRKGNDSGGKISLRLVDHEIRGAWTTSKNTQKESDNPRLADLLWKRIVATVPDGTQVLGDSTPSDNTAAELAYSVTLKLLPGTENRRIELPGSSKVTVEVLDGDLRFSGEKNEVESAVEMNRKIIKSVARTLNDETTAYNEQARPLPSEDATISIFDFKQLNEAKQVAWLKEAVMRFRKESGNISATVVMSTQNFEYEPTSQERSTVLLTTGHTHNYQIRRIGHSYRVRQTQERVQHKDNGAYTANIAHWDAVAGRLRQHDDVRSDSGDHKSQGTIRPERDDITKDCFFLQYLGNDSHGEADAIPELWNPAGRYLQNMDHARVVEIRDSDSTVKIAFTCKMPWGATAESELLFDLAKSGLLIDMTLTELAAEKEITVALRRHRMTMTQPVLVEEVWLPTKIEMTAWSQNYPKQITVFKGKVSDIQLNRLAPPDLEVVFPPGTDVSDKFSGERYVVPFPSHPETKPDQSVDISKPKRLQIREAAVVETSANSTQQSVETSIVEYSGMRLHLDPTQPAVLTEDDIMTVEAVTDPNNTSTSQIVLTLTPEAGERFRIVTTRLSSQPNPRYLLIEFDGMVLSASRVNDKIRRKVTIAVSKADDVERLVGAIREAIPTLSTPIQQIQSVLTSNRTEVQKAQYLRQIFSVGEAYAEVLKRLQVSEPGGVKGGPLQTDIAFDSCDLVLSFDAERRLFRIGYYVQSPTLQTPEYHELMPDLWVKVKADRQIVNEVVRAFVKDAGDVETTRTLTRELPQAVTEKLFSLACENALNELPMEYDYVNDQAEPTKAIAALIALTFDPQSIGLTKEVFVVFKLTMTNEGWVINDIDFESKEEADRELKSFLNANPQSVPSITQMKLDPSNARNAAHATDPADDHDRLQGAWQSLDSKELPVMPSGRNQFSVSFLADRMSMLAPQRAGIGTFRVSTDTTPRQIDCRLTFGEKHIEFIGIYEFRDSQLWLCLTEGEQRPKSFDIPPTVAGLMTFALERKQVELPDADSNASLALSDWSQSQDGAGVFATYTLSIPGIETISQGLAAGGPAVKEFSGVPGFPGKVFTLRYFLPNLSPRGMAFVAGTSFQSSLDLIELAQVAEHKRLVRVFSYPDSATGASDPIGAVPDNRPVETPKAEPMDSSLKISVLKAGASQADWLKEIDATGEIIYGYEIVVR